VATCAVCGYEAADSFRFCPECGARADGQGREQRKVVTVLFCDVAGSTALGESLDAEALRALLARRGEFHEGERLAREAVALAEETDMLNAHADALIDLAEVLTLADQDGRAELEQALALYERKGNLVMAERARSRLAELTAPR
jgi:class 3 adenylate cyclase